MIPLIPIPKEVWLYLLEFIDYESYVRNGGNVKTIAQQCLKNKYKMTIKEYIVAIKYPYLPLDAIKAYKVKNFVVYNMETFEYSKSYSFRFDPFFQDIMEPDMTYKNKRIDEEYLRYGAKDHLKIFRENHHVPFALISKFLDKDVIVKNLGKCNRSDFSLEYLRNYSKEIDWKYLSFRREWTLDEVEEFKDRIDYYEFIDNVYVTADMILLFKHNNWKYIWQHMIPKDDMLDKFPKNYIMNLLDNENLTIDFLDRNFDKIHPLITNNRYDDFIDILLDEKEEVYSNFILKHIDKIRLEKVSYEVLFNDFLFMHVKKHLDSKHKKINKILF